MTVEDAPPRAGRREWIGLAVLALPTLLVSLDLFVMLLAVPHLSADLGASSTQQLWILDIYGFMVAGFLITMGTVGDRSAAGDCCWSAQPHSGSPRSWPPGPPAPRC
jgi:MFS transporter, DHA2 family, multidrug resistance protein